MKLLFAFLLLPLTFPQTQSSQQDRPDLEIRVLNVKETFKRDDYHPSIVSQQPPEIKPNTSRGRDRNEPEIIAIEEDTNQRVKELRSLQKITEKANYRRVYVLKAQMANTSAKIITQFVWAYQFSASPIAQATSERQYLCNVPIEPGEIKEAKVISPISPSLIVNASSARSLRKDTIINQVEFDDGTVWRRADWNPIVLARQGTKKIKKGKCITL